MIIAGAAIFYGMLSMADLPHLKQILVNSNYFYVSVGLALAIFQFVLGTTRWRTFLEFKDIHIRFKELLTSLMIGSFISTFLPSKYAGDIYRVYTVTKHSGKSYDAAASVILSRLSGMFTLAVGGFIAGIYWLFVSPDIQLTVFLTFICFGLMMMCVAFFCNQPYHWFDQLLGYFRLTVLQGPAKKFHEAVIAYRPSGSFFLKVFIISMGIFLNAVVVLYMAPLSIGRDVSFLYLLFILPTVSLVEALPISISGLGIREGALIFFLMKAGLNYEESFAVSILNLFFGLASNAAGGVLFFARHVDIKKIATEQNLPT